jgi:hypothetical protein
MLYRLLQVMRRYEEAIDGEEKLPAATKVSKSSSLFN